MRGYTKLQQRLSSSKPVTAIGESRENLSKTITTLKNKRSASSKNISAFNKGASLGEEFFFRKKKRNFSKNIRTVKMESKQVKKLAKIRKQIRKKAKKLKKRR